MEFAGNEFVIKASLSSNYTSPIINGNLYSGGSVQLLWTGTPVGNFTFQMSNQPDVNDQLNGSNVVDWTTLASSTQAAGGAPGDFAYILAPKNWKWSRFLYTAGSSTGVLRAYFFLNTSA